MTTYYTMLHQVQQSSRASKCLVLVLLIITGALLSVSGSPIPSGQGNSNVDVILLDSSDEDSQQQEENDVYKRDSSVIIALDSSDNVSKPQEEESVDPLETYMAKLHQALEKDYWAIKSLASSCSRDFQVKHFEQEESIKESVLRVWNEYIQQKREIDGLFTKINPSRSMGIEMPDQSLNEPLPTEEKPSKFDQIKEVKQSMNNHRNGLNEVLDAMKQLLDDEKDREGLEALRKNIVSSSEIQECNLKFITEHKYFKVDTIWGTGISRNVDAAVDAQPGSSSGPASAGQTDYWLGY